MKPLVLIQLPVMSLLALGLYESWWFIPALLKNVEASSRTVVSYMAAVKPWCHATTIPPLLILAWKSAHILYMYSEHNDAYCTNVDMMRTKHPNFTYMVWRFIQCQHLFLATGLVHQTSVQMLSDVIHKPTDYPNLNGRGNKGEL